MKNYLTLILSILSLNNYAQSAAKACSDSKIKGYNFLHNRNSRDLSEQSNYDVKFLKLELNVSDTTTFIQGKCTQVVKVLASNMTQFVFELHENLSVPNAKINDSTATVQRFGNELLLESSVLHNLNDLVTIEISYNGMPPASSAFNGETGVYNAKSPTWGVYATWTLSEPFFAHTWWPVKQVLTDKIDSTELIFVCDNNLKVGSNGLLVSEENLPNNKTEFTWKSNYPIDYYLVSFAVAPYQDYSFKILPTGATDSLLIQNYIYNVPNYLDYFEADILETGDMIFLLSDLYGQYPFIKEKYGHCIAPLSGGMEHQTMTTQGFFDSWLTMHELAHQWWGNSVTCATWNDVWINEGFASYSEYLYAQNISQSEADNDMNQRHINIKAKPGGSVYVYDITNSDNIFDSRLIYDKGSAVVHMLRNMINDDALFFEALRKVQNTYKGSTCSTTKLQTLLTQETGVDLNQFMSSWIYGEGYPIYSGSYNVLNDTTYIRINQKSSLTASTLTYPASLELLVTFLDGTDSLLRVSNSDATEDYYFLMNKEIVNVQVDPNNWILKGTDAIIADPNLYFQVINSINEIAEYKLFFNNPINDFLEIKTGSNQNFNLTVLNIKGEIVYAKKDLKVSVKIDSRTWSKGLYFLNTEINNQIKTSKALKL